MSQTYLTRREVAARYPISEHTLAKLASQRRGPAFYKPTDKALYKPEDVERWIEAAMVAPTIGAALPSPPVGGGRGRASGAAARPRRVPTVRETVAVPTGRRLESLAPGLDSWLRRAPSALDQHALGDDAPDEV